MWRGKALVSLCQKQRDASQKKSDTETSPPTKKIKLLEIHQKDKENILNKIEKLKAPLTLTSHEAIVDLTSKQQPAVNSATSHIPQEKNLVPNKGHELEEFGKSQQLSPVNKECVATTLARNLPSYSPRGIIPAEKNLSPNKDHEQVFEETGKSQQLSMPIKECVSTTSAKKLASSLPTTILLTSNEVENFLGENNDMLAIDLTKNNLYSYNYGSVPPSTFPEKSSPMINIPQPPSAPLPFHMSPLSLDLIVSSSTPVPISRPTSPFCQPSSPISGVEPLNATDAEDLCDSETSWIPDSYEEIKLRNALKQDRQSVLINESLEDFTSSDSTENFDTLEFPSSKKTKTKKDKKKKENNNQQTDLTSPDIMTDKENVETAGEIRQDLQKRHGHIHDSKMLEDAAHQNINSQILAINTLQTDMTEREKIIEEIIEEIRSECTDGNENVNGELLQENELEDENNKDLTKKPSKISPNRWKKSKPATWKRNVSKENMHQCLPYVSKHGKIMKPKKPRPAKCNDCRNKCIDNFDEERREGICQRYWKIQNFEQEKNFILKHIKINPVKRTQKNVPEEKQRSTSREYGFYKSSNVFTRVCKQFFMDTLCISVGPIETAIAGLSEDGLFKGNDSRGKKSPSNKTSSDKLMDVRTHIESYPTMASHYCRKTSKRMYLDSQLSISKLYSHYKKQMENENKSAVTEAKYRNVFGTEYNYSFFKPKKDQCLQCNKLKQNKNPSPQLIRENTEHLERKKAANKSKEDDIQRSNAETSYLTVTMDMQSVLQIPMTGDGLLYYSRKLNLQNLSLYESKPPKRAHCFLWTEVNGKRGSIEIASAINKWLQTLSGDIKDVVIYSDTCAGQNRNQYLATYFAYLVQTCELNSIEQKYLESGHSCMEVDSMHSAIEREKRYTPVYSLIDWKGIMRRARSNRHNKKALPYTIHELSYNDMLDIKALSNKFSKNVQQDNDGDKVQWLKVKCIRYEKEKPGDILYRYGYEGPYKTLSFLKKKATRQLARKGRKEQPTRTDPFVGFTIPRAYNKHLPISQAKKRDLINLCKKGVIPEELHSWYESLPSSCSAEDLLPCEDLMEEDNAFDED